MNNNDVLRTLRYVLGVGESALVEITKLAEDGFDIDSERMVAFLKKDDAEGYQECSDAVMVRFLDGLIVHRRGRPEGSTPPPLARAVTNNLVLKKLRVAFELKESDMHEMLAAAGFPMSKPELSALFRSPDHKNFRACGDQVLRNFLRGLSLRQHPAA